MKSCKYYNYFDIEAKPNYASKMLQIVAGIKMRTKDIMKPATIKQ